MSSLKSPHPHSHGGHSPEIEDAEREIREGNRKIDEAIDQFARTVEERFDSARDSINEPLSSARHLMDRADSTIGMIRDRVREGMTEAEELIDRADVMINRVADPIRFVQENPRVGLAIAFMVGMYFGRASQRVRGRGSVRPASVTKISPEAEVPDLDLVRDTPGGEMPDPDEVDRRVEHADEIVEDVIEEHDAPLNYDYDPSIRRKTG